MTSKEYVEQAGTVVTSDHYDGRNSIVNSAVMLPRIAVCAVGELFGGVERHVLGILAGLRAQGVESLLLCFHDGELAAQARGQGISPIVLPNSNRSLISTSRIAALTLKQCQIDIVHVHGYKATVYCALARLWHPFALVKTEHGLPEPRPGRPWQMFRDRLYYLLGHLATHLAGATVCYVTRDLMKHYRHVHLGLRTAVIANGIASMDRRLFARPPEYQRDLFNLIIVGRLDTVKGHHLAIEAISSDSLKTEVHLYFLGIGPCEQELRALVDRLGLIPRVHFLGFRRNVYDYLSHCNALLIPSLHEGLPYALLEAMALEVPIIASRVGGLAEVLENEVTAMLVPPGDVQALAHSIARLQADPNFGQVLGNRAHAQQTSSYSLAAMANSYLDVYRGVVGPPA